MSGVGATRPWKGPSDRSTWRERAILMRASRADLARPLGMESGMGLETAQRTGNQSFLDSFGPARPKVLVIGCGGAGGNSVHRLHRMGIHGARTVVVKDRKSTRLNSSHVAISYAVFCLKKKTHTP